MKFLKKIPNILTTSRGVAGPILPIMFFCVSPIAALITFLTAAVTDLFDGSLARTIPKAESKYGEKADPICDKILGICALITTLFINPFMAIPLILEASIAGVNVINYFKTKKIKSSGVGKIKTVILFGTICLALIPGISPIATGIVLAISAAFQVKALQGYINELKNSKKETIKEIKVEETEKEKEIYEENNQESLEQKLQKKNTKEKYLNLQRIAHDIVVTKENWERQLGEKIFSRKLRK